MSLCDWREKVKQLHGDHLTCSEYEYLYVSVCRRQSSGSQATFRLHEQISLLIDALRSDSKQSLVNQEMLGQATAFEQVSARGGMYVVRLRVLWIAAERLCVEKMLEGCTNFRRRPGFA